VQFIENNVFGVRAALYSLVRPDGAPRFILFPMIHIGSPGYYSQVHKKLDECDIVLYKGVRTPRVRVLTLSYRIVARRKRLGLIAQDASLLRELSGRLIHADIAPGEFNDNWSQVPWHIQLGILLIAPLYGGYHYLTATKEAMPLNPYAPPTAPVAEPEVHGPYTLHQGADRPKLVWVIAAYYGCNVVAAGLGTYLAFSHPNVIPPVVRAQFNTAWSHNVFTLTVALLKIGAVISLVRLRPVAVLLLWLLFAYRAAIFVSYAFQKGSIIYNPHMRATLIGTLVGLITSLVIALYATRLRSRGVLRVQTA
jgi:hypothetical protein